MRNDNNRNDVAVDIVVNHCPRDDFAIARNATSSEHSDFPLSNDCNS